jgi:hypothetical protein
MKQNILHLMLRTLLIHGAFVSLRSSCLMVRFFSPMVGTMGYRRKAALCYENLKIKLFKSRSSGNSP